MDSDHNKLASETTISTQDWNLFWGETAEREAFRGAPMHADEGSELTFQKPLSSKFNFEQQIHEGRRNPLPEEAQEVDPMFLTRFVMFTAQATLPIIWEILLDFIQEHSHTQRNFDADKLNSMIRGFMFDETRFVEYQIKMFTYRGQLGLSLDILDGYAPAVQGFWKDLQQALKEHELIEPQDDDFDDEDESDYGFLDSEDENDSDCLDLDAAKFINLHESPEIVDQWFQDLSNPNFMQQTLLLMAWNCQDKQNFQTITSEKQAQQLFDTIITCMIATAADFCLPIARCASLLVSQLVESHDIEVSNKQFNVLVETLAQWSIKNPGETERLTSSEEVASILSSQMSKMAPLAVNWKDTLERVYTQAPYDCVRQNLSQVIRAY